MNKKFTARILSMLMAMLMLVSMLPTSVFAAPASDIPANMLDNVYLDALEYTGYKVQAQRDDGTIFKKYSGGNSYCGNSCRRYNGCFIKEEKQ